MRDDEELGISREVGDLFESKVVNLNHIIFQVQDNSYDPLGLNDLPNAIELCIVLFYLGVVLFVELKVDIDGVSVS